LAYSTKHVKIAALVEGLGIDELIFIIESCSSQNRSFRNGSFKGAKARQILMPITNAG